MIFFQLLFFFLPRDGMPFKRHVRRVVGGSEVINRRMFPYQVSLRYDGYHFCGAVAYNRNTVLTAAHCLVKFLAGTKSQNLLTVVVGDLNLYHSSAHTRIYSAAELMTKPGYSRLNVTNDVGVVKINGLFEWNDFVRPISLSTKKPPESTKCVALGWGEGSELSGSLLFVNVNIINDSYCKEYIDRVFFYHDGMLCAGALEKGVDVCKGDSGGPLVCNEVLTGIISWGVGCGDPNEPGVYADVSYYREWFERNDSTWATPSVVFVLLLSKLTT